MAKASTQKKKTVTLADIPHVGPGTVCGDWFRRYWVVVGTAQELYDIPRAVKVLGEDLVLFRDQFGKAGCSASTAPIAGLRWNTAISRTADCVVLTTAGCSTLTVSAWKCRRSRKTTSFVRK